MCVAFQPDGKLLVAGKRTDSLGYQPIYLIRLHPDGSLDNSFADNGILATTVENSGNASEHLMKLQADGKILVAGFMETDGDPATAVARFLPDGTPDPSFGNGGLAVVNVDAVDDREAAYSVAVQPDGKIIAAGASSAVPFDSDYTLLRFLPDGSLDAGFGTGGIARTLLPNSYDNSWHVLVQPDGKLLTTGYTNHLFGFRRTMMRYNTDGSLDLGFGTNGVLTNTTDNGAAFMNSLALQPDGKILRAGVNYKPSGTGLQMVVDRFLPDGQKDNSFGTNGRFTYNDDNLDADGAMTLQPDGKVLVVATSFQDITLFRLLENGSIDQGFGTNGYASHFISNSFNPVTMQLDEYLRIVVVGGTGFSIARFGTAPSGAAERASLLGNLAAYPNPATGAVRLDFHLAKATEVGIVLHDAFGRPLKTVLHPAARPAGHGSEWVDLGGLPAGVYYFAIVAGQERGVVQVVVD
ncbi:MAG: hypothetical protein IPM82_08240 [Saprospiraceae bacterium]|nr:hypothetical protein [Saprospiraceae bacterium]